MSTDRIYSKNSVIEVIPRKLSSEAKRGEARRSEAKRREARRGEGEGEAKAKRGDTRRKGRKGKEGKGSHEMRPDKNMFLENGLL